MGEIIVAFLIGAVAGAAGVIAWALAAASKRDE